MREFNKARLIRRLKIASKHPMMFALSNRKIRMATANTMVGVSKTIRFISRHPVLSSLAVVTSAAGILAGVFLRQRSTTA